MDARDLFLLGLILGLAGCSGESGRVGDAGVPDAAGPGEHGCWVYGPTITLERSVCGYSSATAALGSRTTSGYWSPEHPHTCYMQVHDVEDAYDGGCDDAAATGVGTQYWMDYSCDGVEQASGWLDSAEFDGYCGIAHEITACSIRNRAPGC